MQALEGVRIIDLTQIWSGPFATQLLADLGAEVIKVEPVYRLDPDRGMAWPAVGATLAGDRPYNRSGSFNEHNRNKLAITLDLKKPAGVELFKRLVAQADVVIDNFSFGVMARLGLGYERLREANPRLVYCAITGYGQDGPAAQRAGHDIGYVARAGVLGLTGPAEGPPQVPGVQIFHAGTVREGSRILADGGRVLGVTAKGRDIREAQARAYAAVDKIDWPGGFCRRDIGWRAVGATPVR